MAALRVLKNDEKPYITSYDEMLERAGSIEACDLIIPFEAPDSTGTPNADRISFQWMATSPNKTDNARHDQMTACTISTPSVSHPVTPKANRAAMKTRAMA